MTVIQLPQANKVYVERTISIIKVIRAEGPTVHDCENQLDDMQVEESACMDSVMVTGTETGES